MTEAEADTAAADTPLPALEGGCLCGRVRYRAQPSHREAYYCHCRMCQLAMGNTRATFINLARDQVQWLTEEPAWYASSRIARRGFCPQCGTPLVFEYLASPRMDLTVGSLDEPAAFKPISHFAVESRLAPWHVDDGLPGTRLDEYAPIVERWRNAYGDATPGLATARQAPSTP
jgi:hypothetical protein